MIIKNREDDFYLKEISIEDIESIRLWKNKHKNSFFYNKDISKNEQEVWFNTIYSNNEDVMFIVVLDGKKIGCMGYRFKDDYIDVFNIMRGERSSSKGFKMSKAFRLMLEYLRGKYNKVISCVVLNNNPAFNWYLKNGFVKVMDYENYSRLEFVDDNISLNVEIIEYN